jgi:hypothetical protein
MNKSDEIKFGGKCGGGMSSESMFNFINGYTAQLLDAYNIAMERAIREKLYILKSQAIHIDRELYMILEENSTDGDLNRLQQELISHGYSIEIEYPNYFIDSNENILKAIIDATKIKLKVKKIIIEV